MENANTKKLKEADENIRQNLGEILEGDSNFYEKIWYVQGEDVGLKGGYIFIMKKRESALASFICLLAKTC